MEQGTIYMSQLTRFLDIEYFNYNERRVKLCTAQQYVTFTLIPKNYSSWREFFFVNFSGKETWVSVFNHFSLTFITQQQRLNLVK